MCSVAPTREAAHRSICRTANGRHHKKAAKSLLQRGVDLLADYQMRLAAQDTHGVLVCLPALDAAGNPQVSYLICTPDTARAITRRWISEVPSKIV